MEKEKARICKEESMMEVASRGRPKEWLRV